MSYIDLISDYQFSRFDRKILAAFVDDAVDKNRANQYLTEQLRCKKITEFLASWKTLTQQMNTKPEQIALTAIRKATVQRDHGRCCVTGTPSRLLGDHIEAVYFLAPSLTNILLGKELNAPHDLLDAFITPNLRSRLCQLLQTTQKEPNAALQNTWVLSHRAETAFRRGRFRFIPDLKLRWEEQDYSVDSGEKTSARYSLVGTLRDPSIVLKADDGNDILSGSSCLFEIPPSSQALLPHPLLLYIHSCFARTNSLIDAQVRMQNGWPSEYQESRFSLNPSISRVIRKGWLLLPAAIRRRAYGMLAYIGYYLYPPPMSWIQRLPFGLYLKKERPQRNCNEPAALCLVQQYTSIPAPMLIDYIDSPRGKYTITTRVPGRPIFNVLSLMSDAEVSCFIRDLQSCIWQLKSIPNTFQHSICGADGGSLYDYRLPETARGPFNSEADFNKALLGHLSEEDKLMAQPSHCRPHKIYFTHGDLNLSNILILQGRFSGIVDWECAGYYPDYWEKCKALYVDGRSTEWREIIDKVIAGSEIELSVEHELWDRDPF